MTLTGDAHLNGAEADFVVGAHHKDTFDVALAHFLGWLTASHRHGGIRVRQLFVFTNSERDDRNREYVLAVGRHDLGRRREVRARLLGWVQELHADFVVDGLIAGGRGTAALGDGAVGDLDDPADECRVGESVNLDDGRIADADARDVRLVDLDLRFEHAHVTDGEKRCRVLVQRTHDRGFTLFHDEARDLAAHWRDDRGARERLARITHRRDGLHDTEFRRFRQRPAHFRLRLQLFKLFFGNAERR